MKSRVPLPRVVLAATLLAAMLWHPGSTRAADAYVPFDGEKSAWHDGFERFDYVMDEETLAIQPFKAPEGEKFGVKDPAKGQRRCIVIAPKEPAPGNPWSWQGCYWDHQPQTEVELLRRGFHIAYISANATLKPGKEWDAWYAFLTGKHGLSKKPAFIGMSRGGEYSYTWATANPDKVSCIYADNPGANRDLLMKIGVLANNDVPLLHVCGSIDPLLGKYSTAIEVIYQQLGGRISVMIKDGAAHHPHSLRDPKPIADFITQSVQPIDTVPPDYLAGRITKTSFYSIQNSYREFAREGTYITCRGAWFSECYDRYSFELAGVEGAITVIVPKSSVPGKPWVFRADFVDRDAVVDLALLAKGFHIVTGPVSYNTDGPVLAHWNAVYKHLTTHGFSTKPVMEGAGRAAGEAYGWAIENPDKVSCIYAENPVLRSFMSKTPLLESLAPLAKAGVQLMHVCGALDPALNDHTRTLEKRYKELGGSITVVVKDAEGHYPLAPKDPKPVVDFIVNKVAAPATAGAQAAGSGQVVSREQDFQFDGSMSRQVLENYLDRSVSFTELLHDDLTQPRNVRGVDPRDNMRFILETGTKFVGRALMVWGREKNLSAFLETAKPYAAALHKTDPEIILQAAAFEIVTPAVETVIIPERVLLEFGQPGTPRTFHYQDMLYANGRFVNHWGRTGSVPDMSQLETRMWFYFLVTSYIDIGIEAIHFGQVGLMDKNDPGHAGWLDVLNRVRAYARKHARRHFLVCDAHTPTGGYVEDGKLLFDFHSFPLRIAEVADQPFKGVLQVGYSDSIFTKSKGGITPSGWSCEHLPFLVEFDNFGRRNPGNPGKAPFIWGWDEITWFAQTPEKERNDWLRYAWKWVKATDANGHLQMPGSRVLSPGTPDGPRWYWANTRSDACPNGSDTEGIIKELWGVSRPANP